ncbi:MAG: VWA domain-containing protein [Thermomicrobiales bacterium]
MALTRFGTRYSRWDGTQQVDELSADDLMRAMSDELVRDGDLMNALRRLFWEGVDRPDADRLPGLRDLMNRVRQARQEQMQRYDLGSMLDDIRERLQDVIDTERSGIRQRLEEANQSPEEGGGDANGADPEQAANEDESESPGNGLRELLNSIADKRNQQLDALPDDPAGRIRGLQQYDFMDQQARQKFQELMDQLQQQMMNQTFQGMQQSLSQMTPEQIAETRQMMSDLNDMLEAKNRGEDPGFEQFMHKWGHYFGNNIRSLEDLIEHMRQQTAAMQQLMDSMSQEQRSELQGIMQAIMQDPGLQQEMSRMQQNLQQTMRPEDWRRSYDFSGDESLTLQQAMRMLDRMNELDDLEKQFKDVRDWNDFANIDQDKVQELLGEDTREQMDQLGQLAKVLEDAGYIKKTRRGFELTPQGVRKIGEKALTDIFAQLKRDRIGAHEINRQGGAGERTDTSKPYEFGDPFLLDLESTVMNAVQREGRGTPLKIVPSDFEVYRTEYSTRSSTVLMIDMSRSMFYSDSFTSAKRIALALDSSFGASTHATRSSWSASRTLPSRSSKPICRP